MSSTAIVRVIKHQTAPAGGKSKSHQPARIVVDSTTRQQIVHADFAHANTAACTIIKRRIVMLDGNTTLRATGRQFATVVAQTRLEIDQQCTTVVVAETIVRDLQSLHMNLLFRDRSTSRHQHIHHSCRIMHPPSRRQSIPHRCHTTQHHNHTIPRFNCKCQKFGKRLEVIATPTIVVVAIMIPGAVAPEMPVLDPHVPSSVDVGTRVVVTSS